MPSRYQTCYWCKNPNVPRGAYVCRGCGAEIFYGATEEEKIGPAGCGCLLGLTIGTAVFCGLFSLLDKVGLHIPGPLLFVILCAAIGVCGFFGWMRAELRVEKEKADQVTYYRRPRHR